MAPVASVRTWMPAIHAGMTENCFSYSMGKRKIIAQFVVNPALPSFG
jgi:hypothetical protein